MTPPWRGHGFPCRMDQPKMRLTSNA
jgi:hypothetical protein